MKRWVKVREETYAIKLLADHASYPDDATFCLKPFANPNIDAEIKFANEKFNVQITIADPVWNGQNGGYDHRLVMEALNSQGVVIGSSSMHRENGKIVSGLPVKSFNQEFEGCRQGLIAALRRKLRSRAEDCKLLIHARGYSMHTMDCFAPSENWGRRLTTRPSMRYLSLTRAMINSLHIPVSGKLDAD